jgi:uncharacterized lipoprotein YmbA
MTLLRRIAMVAALLALTACASNAPPPLLLTLPAAAPPAGAPTSPATTTPSRTLILRRVSLPEYLLTRRVRYRDSASSLADWPNTYWAERIEVAVTRALSEALRARLPGWAVCEGACADGTTGEAVLIVDYQALDFTRTASSSQLQAVAMVTGTAAGNVRWRSPHRVTIDATTDAPRAHAAAIGSAVQSLADAIAAALRAEAASR